MKRPPSILAALLPALSMLACQQNGFVRVTVGEAMDGGGNLPSVFQLRSLANDSTSDAGSPNSATSPQELIPIVFPKTFVVQLPSSATTLSEVVEGLDATGATVLRGSNSGPVSAGSLGIILTPACTTSLDCDPVAYCAGQLFCTSQGACVASGATSPPGFATPCGNNGGACDEHHTCVAPFGACGDGDAGIDPLPDGGFVTEQCDWGSGADGGPCNGPNGACNSRQPNACRPTCVLPSCGDGVIDNGEVCDKGTGPSGNGTQNGCNATCTLTGKATLIVGNGDFVNGVMCMTSCYADGPGASAEFQEISGLAIVGGSLYVADQLNEAIRAVDLTSPTYNVTTLAGSPFGGVGGMPLAVNQDGVGGDAGFFLPWQPMAYNGTLLIGTGSDIRQVTLPGAVVTTFAGIKGNSTPGDDPGSGPKPLASSHFNYVTGLTLDPSTGFIYSMEFQGGFLRVINPTAGTVTNLVGEGLNGSFASPTSVVLVNGSLFVTDTGNEYVKSVSLVTVDGGTGGTVVVQVAGTGSAGFSDSSASGGATFNQPVGMCTDGKTVYIVDQLNRAVRQMDPVTFEVTTVVGGPSAGVFNYPFACAWDPATGSLYVSDQSRPPASPNGFGNEIYKVQ